MTRPLYPRGTSSDLKSWLYSDDFKGKHWLLAGIGSHFFLITSVVRIFTGPDRLFYVACAGIGALATVLFWFFARRSWRRVTGVEGDVVEDPWADRSPAQRQASTVRDWDES